MSFFIDPVVYPGAPEDLSARSIREKACYTLLERLKVPFERVDHDRADTIEDCKLVESVIGVHICKNLFLQNRQKTAFYLLMMPGDKPFRTSEVSKLLGVARLSFAEPETMESLLHCAPGSASVLGLMNDDKLRVQLLVDEDVFAAPFIRCHPCENTSTLKIRTADLREKILPFLRHKPKILHLEGRRIDAET